LNINQGYLPSLKEEENGRAFTDPHRGLDSNAGWWRIQRRQLTSTVDVV